jgi:hypothetical protein
MVYEEQRDERRAVGGKTRRDETQRDETRGESWYTRSREMRGER